MNTRSLGSRLAIHEVCKVRSTQHELQNGIRWAWGSVALFFALMMTPDDKVPLLGIVRLVVFIIAAGSVAFVFVTRAPRASLNQKQMKLLGLSDVRVETSGDKPRCEQCN